MGDGEEVVIAHVGAARLEEEAEEIKIELWWNYFA